MNNKKMQLAATPYLLWMIIFVIVPLALVVVFAFTTTIKVDAAGNPLDDATIEALREEYAQSDEELPIYAKTICIYCSLFYLQKIICENIFVKNYLKSGGGEYGKTSFLRGGHYKSIVRRNDSMFAYGCAFFF